MVILLLEIYKFKSLKKIHALVPHFITLKKHYLAECGYLKITFDYS